MSHAHPMEVVLLLLSASAVVYTGYNLWGRIGDFTLGRMRFREGSRNSVVSTNRVFDESFRFAKALALLIGALIAIWQPPPPPPYEEIPQSFAFLIVMCIVSALIWLNSWRSLRTQRRLERLASERPKKLKAV